MENEVNIDDIDLTGVDTGMPVLADGIYEFTVTKIEASPNKAGTGNVLRIEVALNGAGKSPTGADINPGFPVFDNISLAVTPKYNPAVNLARFQEATLGRKEKPFGPLERYVGMKFSAKTSIETSTGFPDKNRLRYIKKTVAA